MSLCKVPPNVLATLATIIGVGFTRNLTSEEVDSVANFLQSIGQTMATVSSQSSLLESEKCIGKGDSKVASNGDNNIEENEKVKAKLEELENQINLLKKQLDNK